MDNEAFRALVQERARVKTTKEIAREAVEEEFRQLRSRKRDRDSSSGEDDDSDNDALPSKKEEEEQQQTSKNMHKRGRSSNKAFDQKYRDRAKERREGKNVDYESTTSLLDVTPGGDMDQATLSKYLGGDEAHTHLVKGLDVALARKVKREMGQEAEPETRQQQPHKAQQKQRPPSSTTGSDVQTVTPQNSQDATEFLQRLASNSISSSLGRGMLTYLRRRYLHRPINHSRQQNETSAAGLAIQRSTLTFAMHGHPHDYAHSWEIPRENIHASSHWEDATTSEMSRATTPLDGVFLKRIESALSEHNSSATRRNRHKIHTKEEKRYGAESKDTVGRTVESDDSDEDDIFSDVDDDYVPPSAPSGTTQPIDTDGPEEQRSKTKGSVFAGLTSANYSAGAQQRVKVASGAGDGQPKRVQLPSAPKQKKSSLIDRDLLGTRSMDGSKQRRTAEAGVSISSYVGGYGEEMDVDFDGRFADEDDTSKKAREETTTAALEYGGAGRGRHRDPNPDE